MLMFGQHSMDCVIWKLEDNLNEETICKHILAVCLKLKSQHSCGSKEKNHGITSFRLSGNLCEVRTVCTWSTALKISYCSKFISVVTFLGKVYQEIPNYYLGICLELLKKDITVIITGPVMNRWFLKHNMAVNFRFSPFILTVNHFY
jgi:hypothetical protein